MVDPKIIEQSGLTQTALKGWFDGPADKLEEKHKALVNLIQKRICDGRTRNLMDYRVYAAIDYAYEAPFNQITPTLVRSILTRRHNDPADILKSLESWGLAENTLFRDVKLPDGKIGKMLDEPIFYEVLVPLVKAYTTIRVAKLFNDRNQSPLFKFEPLKFTAQRRILCELITSIVQTMTVQLGYGPVLRQAILQAAMYSQCVTFPQEAWYAEKQEAFNANGAKETKTTKEGLRYALPHPTRTYLDPYYRVSTYNSDTGCKYGGYWSVIRYGEISNPGSPYWNKTQVAYGTTDWFAAQVSGNYFKEFYPCNMQFPVFISPTGDREASAAYYNSADEDKACFLTFHFEKLIPKDWGLGTYEHPVWMRFVLANDTTILYAEPLCFRPVLFCGYDTNELSSRSSSLALEVIPWQDHLGNILSQIIRQSKQNLTELVFYEQNMVSAGNIEKVIGAGNKRYVGPSFIPFDTRNQAHAQLDVKEAVRRVDFGFHSTAELTQLIGTILNILERLLVMSAQEVGGTASHEQTAEEMRTISASTSSRGAYTGTFIDDFIDAWKHQLHEAIVAYMDEKFVANVGALTADELVLAVNELGLNVKPAVRMGDPYSVEGNKGVLTLEGFASDRDGPNRINNQAIAQVMMQTIQAVAASPVLQQVVPPKAILDLLQQAAILAGAPRDFRLPYEEKPQQPGGAPEAMRALVQQVKEYVDSAVQKSQQDMMTNVAEPVAKQLADTQEGLKDVQDVVAKLEQLVQAALSAQPPMPQAPPMMPPPMMVPPENLAVNPQPMPSDDLGGGTPAAGTGAPQAAPMAAP